MDKIDQTAYAWLAAYKIGKVITSNFNLEEVLSLVAKIACSVTKSSAASIVTTSSTGTGIAVRGGFGIKKNSLSKGPMQFEHCVVEYLSSKKKILLIGDIKRKAKFNFPSVLDDAALVSALCVPVIFNRKLLAALILYSDKKDNYIKEHTRISSALACQIALAIQNYHLYNNMHINYFNTIRSLVLAMEARDAYTKGHSERVTEYALLIANAMALAPQQVQMIKYCGLLHDLGKIAISDTILRKEDRLSEEERIQIERHPVEGAEVLSPLAFLRPGISIVKHHHERFDGTGYPDRLKADKIPLAARILACADAYDAMTTDRPYRSKLAKEEALGELKNNSGSQFDPEVVDVFLKNITGD